MSTLPLNPPSATSSGRGELPAYVSNGLVGLRVRDVPLDSGMAIVSGLSGEHPVTRVEAAARAPYPLAGDLQLGRVWLSDAPQCVRFVRQDYDFSCGELHTTFIFEVEDQRAQLEVTTFCSRSHPTLALQEVQVEVDQACDIVFRSVVDPAGVHGRWLRRNIGTPGQAEAVVDGSLLWEALGGLSTCGVAYVSELVGAENAKRSRDEWGEQSPLATEYRLRARRGQHYRLRQIASLVPSELHSQPDQEATRHAALAQSLGYERLREENRAAWSELWRSRVVLHGADTRWQALADAAFFYLNSSVHPSSPASTSIFGLAQWHDYHYYYGHVMWDLEVFALPPLVLLQPDAARTVLDFRFERREAARRNAKLYGRRGLQFPWESSMTTGEESTPGAGHGAWHEDHVTLDVAHAFAQYAMATGDTLFLREHAWPILKGAAEWLASRLTPSRRGYELRQTVGIAETGQPVDNDAFTLMAARVVLNDTLWCAGELDLPTRPSWADMAEHLALPIRDHVIQSHDGFKASEPKGATPGPLAGLFPFWYPAEPEMARATLEFYLGLADKYIGSPMLSAMYGVWAAWLGDRRRSLDLFDAGYGQFVDDRFMQTYEYRPDRWPEQPKAGPFFANMGGFLLGLLYGLPGLHIRTHEPSTWPSRPVVLPETWDAVEVEQLWVHGRPARLIAPHGADRARIELHA
jgi:hypothetical protein